MLEIRWEICFTNAKPSFNFLPKVCYGIRMQITSANIGCHENSFEGLAKCSETLPWQGGPVCRDICAPPTVVSRMLTPQTCLIRHKRIGASWVGIMHRSKICEGRRIRRPLAGTCDVRRMDNAPTLTQKVDWPTQVVEFVSLGNIPMRCISAACNIYIYIYIYTRLL